MAVRAGDMVGPYEVQQILGRGSYSTVLLGQDLHRRSCRFALKVIACDHLDTNSADKAMKEAIAEADLLQRLRHPNIVSCHQLCWDIERCAVWLALDFMDGGDVQRLIDGWRSFSSTVPMNPGKYQASLLRRFFSSVASALIYIHSQGVLHRDVKPSNVLMSRDFLQIRLADFGLSKILEATGHARSTVGTPYYLSPEIICGEPYGHASDAWAVGVCLYELAALHRPFTADNQLALAMEIAQKEYSALPEGCAQDVADIVRGLLNKQASSRLELKRALGLLHDNDFVQSKSPNATHCLAVGVHLGRSVRPRKAFASPERQQHSGKRRSSWKMFSSKFRVARGMLSVFDGKEHASVSPVSDFQEAEQAQSKKGIMKLISCPCVAGHAFQQFTDTSGTASCDMCRENAASGAVMWGCRTCDFRICESCSRGEAEWTVLAVDDADDPIVDDADNPT